MQHNAHTSPVHRIAGADDEEVLERFHQRAAQIKRHIVEHGTSTGPDAALRDLRAAKDSGKTLFGLSSSWTGALKMAKDLDIDTTSVFHFLSEIGSGKRTLTKDHVVVFDDALAIGIIVELQKAAMAAGATLMLVMPLNEPGTAH
ncbi:hypothetical protein [Burkholderia vietnamiensis]|uniref:hypothetical protein n=1 Tax=Burkholderia vietnamiensis TaxID=60552 RepID=UPI001CF46FCF|nr:hypothetical protein [Burkholderia vietnamiensis]MCA8448947.1 hypothetical protein [Burkholderia vietnamiensis]